MFESVNFGIERGEFVCIIGHSGCGKTTILNVLAGLEQRQRRATCSWTAAKSPGPSLDRGVVFQGHALMPWLIGAQEHRLRGQVALAGLERPRRSTRTARRSSTWWA